MGDFKRGARKTLTICDWPVRTPDFRSLFRTGTANGKYDFKGLFHYVFALQNKISQASSVSATPEDATETVVQISKEPTGDEKPIDIEFSTTTTTTTTTMTTTTNKSANDEKSCGEMMKNGDDLDDIPCFAWIKNTPCWEQFKDSYACTINSGNESKGDCSDKYEQFIDCTWKHPDMFPDEMFADQDDESVS